MPTKVKTRPRAQKKAPARELPFEDFGSEDESAAAVGQEMLEDDEEGTDVLMEEIEKDDEEIELEKLIFGDQAGFRDGIKGFARDRHGVHGKELVLVWENEEEEQNGLGQLEDADLFFVDSGPVQETSQALVPITDSEAEDAGARQGRDPPAWEDSDDERIMISLASVPRLRKLRVSEDEDVVNGKEYVRRLRRQFERLHPVPEWASHATSQKLNKRRRRRNADDGDDDDDALSEEHSSSADEMDTDDESLSAQPLAKLLRDADVLSRGADGGPRKRRKLRPEVIDIQRTRDISGTQPSAITSLSFHPTLPLMLSSGPSSTLYLHRVQPQPPNPHPLLTSLHMKRTPLTTTAFHPLATDSRIFLSARRRFFHVWNLSTGTIEKITRVYGHGHEQRSMERFSLSPNGKYMALLGSAKKGGGVINLLDASTLQWLCQARIESRGGIADFAWWRNGEGLVIAGKNGEVTEWSVEERRALGRWTDEGAVGTTTIALGGDSGRPNWLGGDRWVAVGSSSGIVNVYDRRVWAADAAVTTNLDPSTVGVPKAPKPLRALSNLTTAVSHLTFSPDGQVLAMGSRWKKDALRLVHMPSATVYRNWPTGKTPLGRVSAVAWGEVKVSGDDKDEPELYLAVGNEAGRIRLWEVRG